MLEAAELANAGHFVVVCKSGAGSSNEGPLSGISTFFSNLFNRGLASGDADIIERVVETDLNFTVIKTGSTEGVDDYSPETSNLVVAAEGASDTGGKVCDYPRIYEVYFDMFFRQKVFSNIATRENCANFLEFHQSMQKGGLCVMTSDLCAGLEDSSCFGRGQCVLKYQCFRE